MFSWKSRSSFILNPDVLSEVDFCRLCRFGFRDKQRKRNVVGELTKMFEKVVGVKVLEGDKRAVCDTCRCRGRGIVEDWDIYVDIL